MELHWLEQSAADVTAGDDWLSSAERLRAGDFKIAKRRANWRLGRWTAKHAVAACLHLSFEPANLAAIEIRPDTSGAPDAFIHGEPAKLALSLSHRNGIAFCVVAPSGTALGCDLELVEARIEAFVADYFTSDEQAIITQSTEAERDRLVTILWSAKESALKALRTGLRVDTRSVSAVAAEWRDSGDGAGAVKITDESHAWSALQVTHADGKIFHGWWKCAHNLARTVVSIPSAGKPTALSLSR